jgi:DUF1009 family protein
MPNPPKLGIIAGRGALPGLLAQKCRETGRPVFVMAIEGEADPTTLPAGIDHAWTRMGAAGAAIKRLKREGVVELVMAGGVRRPSLMSLRPDWRAARMYARIGLRALGDDGLLSSVIKELESEGFTLVGLDSVLTDALARPGYYGRYRPDRQAEVDINHGFAVVAALGALDIGQAAIVQQGIVLGVEALEGTDALIERCGQLRREGPGGVLIKARKPGQERRADLPTIGPTTIEHAAAAGLRGIAIEAGGGLVVDLPGVIRLADQFGLFVLGREA